MASKPAALPEVFSPREIARAAGVPVRQVRQLIRTRSVVTLRGGFLTSRDALRVARAARAAHGAPERVSSARDLFQPPTPPPRVAAVSLVASLTFHTVVGALVVLATTVGLTGSEGLDAVIDPPAPVRLVYLAQPGPGGGGGGGGLRQPAPAARAERNGSGPSNSPVTARLAPDPFAEHREPPRVVPHEPLPPIVAPVVTVPADWRDRIGVLDEPPVQAGSRGPGTSGGAGHGEGSGLGEGQGPGIGPGSGGGMGSGPYRPGSGVEPPRLLAEVRPDYTEEARRRHIEGEVLLEVVVRRDGTVGDVRLVRGLGYGLDERAIQAVRQWRFAPGRRLGTPVDVLVEVAVEFRVR